MNKFSDLIPVDFMIYTLIYPLLLLDGNVPEAVYRLVEVSGLHTQALQLLHQSTLHQTFGRRWNIFKIAEVGCRGWMMNDVFFSVLYTTLKC